MLRWFLLPLQYGFMQRGIFTAVIVGIVCAVIGCFVVLRSMSFLGDAMAHAILPGVAVAYILNVNLTIGALTAAAFAALGINALSGKGKIKEDTAIGIIFTLSLALGVALISSMRSYSADLSHILFGNVLGVSQQDLLLTVFLGVGVLMSVFKVYQPLSIYTFDPIFAATLKINIRVLRAGLFMLIAFTIVIALQSVGVSLAVAMLVIPPAAAQLIARRLPQMIAISAIIGGLSGLIGLYASYFLNVASGAAVVLTAGIIFGWIYFIKRVF